MLLLSSLKFQFAYVAKGMFLAKLGLACGEQQIGPTSYCIDEQLLFFKLLFFELQSCLRCVFGREREKEREREKACERERVTSICSTPLYKVHDA
jgi:hypothetical protein